MELLVVLFLVMLGLVVGSFLNVLIVRTLSGESWVGGRSRCDHCKKIISWYDNIPLLSFLLLRGKCRRCKRPISWQNPLVELTTALLFVWWYAVGFAFFRLTQVPLVYVQPLFWLLVGVLLLIILVTDLISYLIPDYAVVGLVLLAVGYRLVLAISGVMQWGDVAAAVLAGFILAGLFSLLIVATRGKGMGWGDVKLSAALGLLLGYPRVVVGVMVAFVLGAVVAVFLLATGKRRLGQVVPFGPFLVLGAVVALMWGGQLWQWYWGLL